MKELCYIDDDTLLETKDQGGSSLKPHNGQNESAVGPSESSGLKPQDPIDLDPPETERPAEGASRSPPPVPDDIDETTAKAAEENAPLLAPETNVLQLEKQVCYPNLSTSFCIFSTKLTFYLLTFFGFALFFSG
jgi:hypothetical protein